MFPLVLLGLTATFTASAVALKLHRGTVYPFAPAPHTAADTLDAHADTDTVFADDGWSFMVLSDLGQVESLLDSLEAHHVEDREVCALGNSSFRVRWR